jgi:hypothetical protein
MNYLSGDSVYRPRFETVKLEALPTHTTCWFKTNKGHRIGKSYGI